MRSRGLECQQLYVCPAVLVCSIYYPPPPAPPTSSLLASCVHLSSCPLPSPSRLTCLRTRPRRSTLSCASSSWRSRHGEHAHTHAATAVRFHWHRDLPTQTFLAVGSSPGTQCYLCCDTTRLMSTPTHTRQEGPDHGGMMDQGRTAC
jgi:hypothetical protein